MAKCGKGKVSKQVRCGERTKPPHTDEKNPGTCSRVKAFCLAPGEPDPDWACWQHRYRTVENQREFQNCADAAAALQKDAEANIPAATTAYQIKSTVSYTNGNNGSEFTCDATVYWQVDWGSMVINMPQYSWPNMTDAEKAAVQSALDALRQHEEGHVNITEQFVDELSNSAIKISGSGATPAAARKDCENKVASHQTKTGADLRNRQDEYDHQTHHGANQSAIGGTDVKLICPSE